MLSDHIPFIKTLHSPLTWGFGNKKNNKKNKILSKGDNTMFPKIVKMQNTCNNVLPFLEHNCFISMYFRFCTNTK